jgi:hypothetical protein
MAIMKQSMIPSWVLNQDMYQSALNVQFDLMNTANSEKVRTDAANSLLTHLKAPEAATVELNITHKEDGSIAALREATLKLVAQQRLGLQAGMINLKEVAVSQVIIENSTGELDPVPVPMGVLYES